MTTDRPSFFDDEHGAEYVAQLQHLVTLYLERIRLWTDLPEERGDWQLEVLLDELQAAAVTLRNIRNETSLPF